MTVTDQLSEDDLLLLTEPEPDPKSRREPPPGAEAMARPWRLGVVGVGITIGLIARLLAANGYFSVNSTTLVYAAAATSLLAGVGLIASAAQRDRFDRWMVLLAGGTGLSLGALQWASPHFASGTLEWSNAGQISLAVLGTANGVLLAGILTLAFVRRWPTMSVVGVLAAGVLTLAADSVLLRNEWPSIGALALAFGGVLLAWDQAPRHEPTYAAPSQSPRISRAALSLATVALGGWVLQQWLSGGESIRRIVPAGVLSAVLILLAFLAMIRIRREIQRRETTMNEWTSWMREIRTGDLRSDFETLGTAEDGRMIGDVTGETPRALSFPDLRVADQHDPAAAAPAAEATAVEATAGPETEAAPAAEATEQAAPSTPVIDIPDVAVQPAQPPAVEAPLPAEAPQGEPAALPDPTTAEIPIADPPTAPEPLHPTLFGEQPPAASGVVWADDLADEPVEVPVIADDQPSLFDFQSDLAYAELADLADKPPPPAALPVTGEVEPVTATPVVAPAIPVPPAISVPPAIPGPPSASEIAAPEPQAPAAAAAAKSAFSSFLDDPPLAGPAVEAPSIEAGAAAVAAQPAGSTGAFSSWLDDSPTEAASGTIDDLMAWLAPTPDHDTNRLVAAVETMSLADFDELPTEVSTAATSAMVERLRLLAPMPGLVATIDGPYLMVAWASVGQARLGDINRALLDAMATPVDTVRGAVGLTGTLALLRPVEGATADDLIEQAIRGLVQARQLEASAQAR